MMRTRNTMTTAVAVTVVVVVLPLMMMNLSKYQPLKRRSTMLKLSTPLHINNHTTQDDAVPLMRVKKEGPQ